MTQPLLPEVVAWFTAGAMPIPVRPDGTKAPAVKAWKDWQHERPPLDVIVAQFAAADTDGVGVICGAASGGLEMIELEGRAITEGWLDRLEATFDDHGPEMRALWDRVAAGYVERTPSGGLHWYYRVTGGPAAGNTKLASRLRRTGDPGASPVLVMIETRGQGGFSVVAPSGGRTHKTGGSWEAAVGTPADIPTITREERDALHAIASVLDETPAQEWSSTPGPTAPTGDEGDLLKPGQDFNERGGWDFLSAAGWQPVHRWAGGRIGWTRPGKDPRDGISATTGGAADGIDRLYVFSSSTIFETEHPYTRFGAYTIMRHGGDFAAAARALRAEGYGDSQPEPPALTLLQGDGGGSNTTPPTPPEGAAMTAGSAALAIDASEDPETLPRIIATSLTDAGNADLLVARHGHHLRYVPEHGHWLAWDGSRWKPCIDIGEARQAAQETIRAIPPDDPDVRKHKGKSLSRRSLDAMVDLASSHPALRVSAAQLDAAPMVLNTPGGLVDLTTGLVRPAQASDMATKLTRCAPDLHLPAPRWTAFLADTFGGDAAMTAFVQRLAGYSAWGRVTHHVLPFLHGPGGNGKSVFMDVLVALLGDYASTAPPSFLIAGRDDESAIARLAGLRMVVSSEVNQGTRFDEAKTKLLTGGDLLTARFLYGKHFTFKPSHTLWISGNHQPRVEAGGESFWRRLRLIPFVQTVTADKRIENLTELLIEEEGPAILAWIISGALAVSDGLAEPEGVRAATADYAAEEDHLGRWVEERLMLTASAREKASDVRADYAAWCKSEGEVPVSNQILVRELRDRWGLATTKSNGTRYYAGATLYADANSDPDSDPKSEHWSDR